MHAGQKLREARIAADMTQDDVVYESRRLLPKLMWIKKSKLSRIENAQSATLDPHTVEFLCHLYGLDINEVLPEIGEALRQYRRALRSRCDSVGAQPRLPLELPPIEVPDVVDLRDRVLELAS
jgi:transcriptional regulator with XRE-family HTH domain